MATNLARKPRFVFDRADFLINGIRFLPGGVVLDIDIIVDENCFGTAISHF
jgi:hypothetical protein